MAEAATYFRQAVQADSNSEQMQYQWGLALAQEGKLSVRRQTIYGQPCELIAAVPEPIEAPRSSCCVRVSPMKQGSTFRRSEDCVLKLTAMRIPTNGPRIPN